MERGSGTWKWKVDGPVEVEGFAVAEIRIFWILQVFVISAWSTFRDRSPSSEGVRHSSLGIFRIWCLFSSIFWSVFLGVRNSQVADLALDVNTGIHQNHENTFFGHYRAGVLLTGNGFQNPPGSVGIICRHHKSKDQKCYIEVVSKKSRTFL